MNWLKVLEGLTEIGLYIKRAFVKSEKERYETERKATSNAPADAFQRSFDASGLRKQSKLRTDKANDGDRG